MSDDPEQPSEGLKEFYAGCDTLAARAKKAAELPDVDFVCIRFDLADPNRVETTYSKPYPAEAEPTFIATFLPSTPIWVMRTLSCLARLISKARTPAGVPPRSAASTWKSKPLPPA